MQLTIIPIEKLFDMIIFKYIYIFEIEIIKNSKIIIFEFSKLLIAYHV